jgi:hypothetical protein
MMGGTAFPPAALGEGAFEPRMDPLVAVRTQNALIKEIGSQYMLIFFAL